MGIKDARLRGASGYNMWSRRDYLVATVGLAALSGCAGDTGNGETTTAPEDEGEELPEGVSRDEFENGPVPEVYMRAVSLGEEERDPDSLQSKTAVSFSEFEEAQQNNAYQPGSCCANCDDYIPDKNGDTFGACAAVQGYIDGADWCTVWEELPEPSVPEGMSEDDLATAAVPDDYRTAGSQVGEARKPNELFTQDEVNLTESVKALAEGAAPPGQSCGNCAEFIPDKNGDGWGACAKVEGYIAIEDWCSVWEHISKEL